MTIQEFNEQFTYVREFRRNGKRLDRWRVLTKPPYEGDCEDYALTCLWILSGESWPKFWWALLTGRAKIVGCKYRGTPHAILRWEGRYIDNIQRQFRTLDYLKADGYVMDGWLMHWITTVAGKLLLSK